VRHENQGRPNDGACPMFGFAVPSVLCGGFVVGTVNQSMIKKTLVLSIRATNSRPHSNIAHRCAPFVTNSCHV